MLVNEGWNLAMSGCNKGIMGGPGEGYGHVECILSMSVLDYNVA